MTVVHWGALATAIVAICVAVVYFSGCFEGCYKTKEDVSEIPKLRNKIDMLFSLRFGDSIRETQKLDDIFDSLYDHRVDLEELYRHSSFQKIIFRGGE